MPISLNLCSVSATLAEPSKRTSGQGWSRWIPFLTFENAMNPRSCFPSLEIEFFPAKWLTFENI